MCMFLETFEKDRVTLIYGTADRGTAEPARGTSGTCGTKRNDFFLLQLTLQYKVNTSNSSHKICPRSFLLIENN